jgi:hypothetical protein
MLIIDRTYRGFDSLYISRLQSMPGWACLTISLSRRLVKRYSRYITVLFGLLLIKIQQLYHIYALTQFCRSQVSSLDILECLHAFKVVLQSLESLHRRKAAPVTSVSLLEYTTTGSCYLTHENMFGRSFRRQKASNDVVIVHKDQIVPSIVTLVTPRVSRDLSQTLRSQST